MDVVIPVRAESLAELKAELQRLSSQMQNCSFSLRFSSVKCRCKILGGSLFLLTLLSVLMWGLCGFYAGAVSMAGSVVVLALMLYKFCQLPRTWRLESDLRRLSLEFKRVTLELKCRVDDEVWFPSLSSRWHNVEELEKAGACIHSYVNTGTFQIFELDKRLNESQKLLSNI